MNCGDSWPNEGKQWLGRCILCGSVERTLLHDGLEDRTTGAAPGRWTLHRCARCALVYLDPRPAVDWIGRAYAGYYTHADDEHAPPWRWPGWRSAFRRAWLNARHGHRFSRAFPLGDRIMALRPRSCRRLDIAIRHLPPAESPDARLLDIGCGSGAFLDIAGECGYRAQGLELDPDAVAAGRRHGRDIRQGSVPGSGLPASTFDHVTLSHVLEHFHEPRAALAEIRDLLRPGGRLWLTQPNPDSDGHRRFGRDWRGLEPPRHMALYPSATLARLLTDIGYERVGALPTELAARFYYRQSMAIAQGIDPYGPADPDNWRQGEKWADMADSAALADPSRAESLTLVAFRPATG